MSRDALTKAPVLDAAIDRRPFTAQEYWRMWEDGIFREGERLELIGGEIVRMSPISSAHGLGQGALLAALAHVLWGRFTVAAPITLTFADTEVYEADALVLDRPPRPKRTDPVQLHEIVLVGETAWSSRSVDVDIKGPVYARAGVPEYWVLDLKARELLVFRDPVADGYRQGLAFKPGQSVAPLCLPEAAVDIDDLL